MVEAEKSMSMVVETISSKGQPVTFDIHITENGFARLEATIRDVSVEYKKYIQIKAEIALDKLRRNWNEIVNRFLGQAKSICIDRGI